MSFGIGANALIHGSARALELENERRAQLDREAGRRTERDPRLDRQQKKKRRRGVGQTILGRRGGSRVSGGGGAASGGRDRTLLGGR